MNLYLILIALISVISCALIIICINKPSSNSSLPTDGSKSPLRQQGMTQTQKSQLLLIVCVIFFLSLVTTDIKTSKFTKMFNNLISFNEKGPSSTVIDLKELFYGPKGNCQFQINKHKYPFLFEYLNEGKMEQKFLDKLVEKNFNQQLFQRKKEKSQFDYEQLSELIIMSSNRHNLGTQITLPWISQKLCKSTSNHIPIMYLNLSKQITTQKSFSKQFKLNSYQTLKQSMCRLNGVQITKQIQKIGDYYLQRETYYQLDSKKKNQRQNAYLVIDNFQYLNQLLIFNKNAYLPNIHTCLNPSNNQSNSQNKHYPQFLGPKYQLFIDKLLNDLIPNCRINLILHTNDHNEVTKLYSYWKMFNPNLLSSPQSALSTFPFKVRSWQGFNKIQFYEILKQIIPLSNKIKGKQDIVWKIFEKSFGKVSISSRKVISNDKEQTVKVQNNQQILISEIQQFFVKLTEELSKDPAKKATIKIKQTSVSDIKQKIAQHFGLGPAYMSIKNLFISSEKGVSWGSVKKKVSINDLLELQKLQLLYIKQGRVYLVD